MSTPAQRPRRFAFGSDEVTEVSNHVRRLAEARGDVVVVVEGVPWPDVGRQVATAVATGDADVGIVMCWTGTGVSIAANKVAGVRAALCADASTATGARRWNDANVLALGMRSTSSPVAEEILDAFLSATPDPGELATIRSLEGGTLAQAERGSAARTSSGGNATGSTEPSERRRNR